MRARTWFFTAIFFPSLAFASTIGFPDGSVWLSDMSPEVGENVRIYAVVYNGTNANMSGTVTFLVDDTDNGSKVVSLDSGESTVVVSPWTATEGTHTFSAQFAGDGTQSQTSERVTVQVKPAPSQTELAVAQAKNMGEQFASVSIPVISTAANTVFSATESIRNAGISYLEKRTPSARTTTTKATSTSVEGFVKGESAISEPGLFSNIAQTTSAAALFTLKSMWLFYPLLVIVLFLLARLAYKWATGPRF